MRKVHKVGLVGVGVASGLASGLAVLAAVPAGAIGVVGGGGGCTTGHAYLVTGQVNSGPDAGDQLAGQLCIQSAARGVTVVGAVSELQPFANQPQVAASPAPSGLPLDVSGTTARLNIRFDGRFRGAFVQATGSQVPALPNNTYASTAALRLVAPSYGGTFNGFQRGDVGVWRADPADIARMS
jgi:hypothetical protein